MPYYSISYDLNQGKDYGRIIGQLERVGAVKVQRSQWLAEITNDIDDVIDYLKNYVDSDDYLLVIQFTQKPRVTHSLNPASLWIKKHFP